jgi:hypothetical protein
MLLKMHHKVQETTGKLLFNCLFLQEVFIFYTSLLKLEKLSLINIICLCYYQEKRNYLQKAKIQIRIQWLRIKLIVSFHQGLYARCYFKRQYLFHKITKK